MTQANSSSQEGRSRSFDRKVQYVIVYDPSEHALSTEPLSDPERTLPLLSKMGARLTPTGTTGIFQVRLPSWRNRVDIYLDEEAKQGLVATVQLDRLGLKNNWQRRLRHNYTSLYVRGAKPRSKNQTDSFRSSASTMT